MNSIFLNTWNNNIRFYEKQALVFYQEWINRFQRIFKELKRLFTLLCNGRQHAPSFTIVFRSGGNAMKLECASAVTRWLGRVIHSASRIEAGGGHAKRH